MTDFRRFGSKLIERIFPAETPPRTVAHWCPACKRLHDFAVDGPFSNGARWSWDGDREVPTFGPSMVIRTGPMPRTGVVEVCHYFLRAGRIQYLADSTHGMSGTTVDLPDIPPEATKWLTEVEHL